jgi:hypothetical protein
MTTTLIATLTLGLLQAPPVQPARTQPSGTAQPAPAMTTPEPAPTTEPSVAPAEPAPAPAPQPAPTGILYMPDAAPVVTAPDPVVVEQTAAETFRRLVFSNFYTLNLGMYPIPSGELSVFLGTSLRPRKSVFGTDWNTAIGYQLTMSLGYADFWFSESQPIQDRISDDEFFRPDPIFFHRHTLLAQGHGGRRGRLYYAMGGGAVMWHTLLIGIEAEGKLGYIFSARENSRTKGIVGGQLRLGGPFDSFPLPQFGAFIGFMVF